MGTSKDEIRDKMHEEKKKKNFYRRQMNRYKKGFEIMYEFFDSIADEQKEEVSKQLNKLGL